MWAVPATIPFYVILLRQTVAYCQPYKSHWLTAREIAVGGSPCAFLSYTYLVSARPCPFWERNRAISSTCLTLIYSVGWYWFLKESGSVLDATQLAPLLASPLLPRMFLYGTGKILPLPTALETAAPRRQLLSPTTLRLEIILSAKLFGLVKYWPAGSLFRFCINCCQIRDSYASHKYPRFQQLKVRWTKGRKVLDRKRPRAASTKCSGDEGDMPLETALAGCRKQCWELLRGPERVQCCYWETFILIVGRSFLLRFLHCGTHSNPWWPYEFQFRVMLLGYLLEIGDYLLTLHPDLGDSLSLVLSGPAAK